MSTAITLKGADFTIENLSSKKTAFYLFSIMFVAGNLALPYICHAIPNGGKMFLPIFFFTLIAGYKFGWKTGVLTAVVSPLANYLLLGMPAAGMLLSVIGNSILIAAIAAFIASKTNRISLSLVMTVTVSHQVLAALISLAFGRSFDAAYAAIITAIPGMILQIAGGCAVLRALRGYEIKNS